jgi:AraC family transcriptional activator of pobA
MHNVVATFGLERLSAALETEWWNKDEFVVFSGHLPPPVLKSPYRQDYYSFFIAESGVMEVEIDVVKYTVRKNDLLFNNPSHVAQMYSISPDMAGKVIAFKKEFLDGELFNPTEKLSFINTTPILSLEENEALMVRELIQDMKVKLADSQRPNRRQVAINLIGVLLHEIDAIFRLKRGNPEKKLTNKETLNNQFHNLVSTFFLKERSVKFYASMLDITPRYLNELTRELTGKSASDQIEEMIVREAKIFLKNTNLSVKEIAEALNFSDQFTFSKYFKKSTKVSPTEYREAV